MPALKICGHQYLIAPDDLVFFVPWLILLHALWAGLDYLDVVKAAMDLIKCPESFREYDISLLLATIPIDFLISTISACGAIMKPRRCGCMLSLLIVIRLLFAVPIVINFVEVMRLACEYLIVNKGKIESDIEQKGLGSELLDDWGVYLLLFLIVWRFLWYLGLIGFMMFLFVPQTIRDGVFNSGLRLVLFLIGCRDNIINSLMSIIMNDLGGTTTLEKVAPSDWIFGLFLAAARQKQGLLGYDPDAREVYIDEEKHKIHTRPGRRGSRKLPPTVKRASILRASRRPVTPLDPANAEDHTVLNEVVRLSVYASGIYGQQFGMALIKDMVEPGTSVPTLCRCCRACYSGCTCVQAHACDTGWDFMRRIWCCVCCYYCCAPAGKTEDDFSAALNEDALYRSVATGAKRQGTAVPELVWASWKNMGPATSPPIGVLVDHQRQEIIITVRGTADIKDCIADAGAKPLFFDPFNWAKEGQRTMPPFDSEEDLFVHGTMLLCAEDAHHRLRHKRIVEELLASNCRGYGIVCVGHSLGAGVACILALIMKQWFKDAVNVRYLGFEPPGGLLCSRISRETQRLGWIAVVCAYDWVPRIGIRNLQSLKVLALEELEACDRSKLQLSWLLLSGLIKQIYPLCCFRRPLAALFRCLGGGALPENKAPDDEAPLVPGGVKNSSAFNSELTFPELWPPGDILYLRPTESIYRCGFLVQKDVEWTAEWADPQDLDELLLTARAIDLHLPWVYEDAVDNVAQAFDEEAGTKREVASAKEKRSALRSRSQRPEFAA